jgi:hypothetical protein
LRGTGEKNNLLYWFSNEKMKPYWNGVSEKREVMASCTIYEIFDE